MYLSVRILQSLVLCFFQDRRTPKECLLTRYDPHVPVECYQLRQLFFECKRSLVIIHILNYRKARIIMCKICFHYLLFASFFLWKQEHSHLSYQNLPGIFYIKNASILQIFLLKYFNQVSKYNSDWYMKSSVQQ